MCDYPHRAGHRGIDTSIGGVEAIDDKLPRLQGEVFTVIAAAGERGLTGDEAAALLGWERHRIRPRTSELRLLRRIGDSGGRRNSDSGIASIVWVARQHLDREVLP